MYFTEFVMGSSIPVEGAFTDKKEVYRILFEASYLPELAESKSTN